MCNEKEIKKEDIRFIDYRLDQLEMNLRKGIEKLEQDQQQNNKEILETLRAMQLGLNEQNKNIIQLKGEVATLKEKVHDLKGVPEHLEQHDQQILNITKRLNNYFKVIVIVVGVLGAIASSIILELIKLL